MVELKSCIFALALWTAAPLYAAHAEEDLTCRNGLFSEEQHSFKAAVVQGSGPAYFIDDMKGCPNREPRCQARAYVVPGDQVITGRSFGAFVCVYYPSKDGGWAGWMPSDRVRASPQPDVTTLQSWAGRWAEDDDTIVLRPKGALISAGGDGYWPSAHPPESEFPGGPNLGEFEGAARPEGGVLTVKEGECKVNMRRVGPWLVVDDNRQCGGMNVTFTGVYHRR